MRKGVRALVGTVALAACAVGASPTWSDTGDAGVRSARKCTITKVQTRAVKVYRVNAEPYEYRVEGRVYIKRPRRMAGCRLLVCEAEELGAGNWVPSWCNRYAIARGVRRYTSIAPYVDCADYRGTGYFRSYARFEGSGVSKMGVERRLCRNGKPVY